MKIFKGYVGSRTKEAALAAVLGAMFFVLRTIKIPLFPPLVMLEFAQITYSVAILVLSYPYVLVFVLFLAMTSTAPITIIAGFLGLSTSYFIAKAIGIKWAKHLVFFTSSINCAYVVVIFVYILKMFPTAIVIPLMAKSLMSGTPTLIIAPLFISLLDRMGVIELPEE